MPLQKGELLLCEPLSLMALLPLKGALPGSTDNHTDPGMRGQETPLQRPEQLRSPWLQTQGQESPWAQKWSIKALVSSQQGP